MYEPRTYRHWIKDKSLISFNVVAKETDLYIRASSNLQQKAHRIVLKYRRQLEDYIQRIPAFATSLEPLFVSKDAPAIAKQMAEAGQKAGVGPMAAVAGAIAECVGKELLDFTPEIIVENGGDIYIKTLGKRTVGIFVGDSPLTGKIGLEIESDDTPLGICTSSGTVGHSLSYGKSDAVVVLSASTALADAAATAIGNKVNQPEDIDTSLHFGQSIDGLKGVVIIVGEKVGAWGDVKLCETSV